MSDTPLRQMLQDAADEHHGSMKDFTVLATQNDPFRLDTPANHRDGEWLATTARDLGLGDRVIHLRGLHYMVIGRPKPDGTAYTNTDADWTWLQAKAGKAARWLGYIPFDQIIDQRNAEPLVRLKDRDVREAWVEAGLYLDLPSVGEITPRPCMVGFEGVQPYRLVLTGEKSSLAVVLEPIAERYAADLYLPTGEMSDTMIHQMARDGAADGRPMVVLTFSDADPAGWQMPISIGRKLQAFAVELYPDLEVQVYRVGLTPDQVREHGLPSTPLKPTEKRADRWRSAMGTEQTEIDSLVALDPDTLATIAVDAVEHFYDTTLSRRVEAARREWRTEAQQFIDRHVDQDVVAALHDTAARKLAEVRDEVETINDQLESMVNGIELPVPAMPPAMLEGRDDGLPLLDTRWSFAHQTQSLIDSGKYLGGGA